MIQAPGAAIATPDAKTPVTVEMSKFAMFQEGVADFAFATMPRFPFDPNYMKGWIERLQQTVEVSSSNEAVYPEPLYKVSQTSDPLSVIFCPASVDSPST